LSIVCLAHVFNLLSAAILGLSVAVFVVLFLLNSVVARYENEIARIERETPYALEELATIYLSTESLFDAILDNIPPPQIESGPFQMLVSNLDFFAFSINLILFFEKSFHS
jgi:hypothetical protein